MEKVPVYYHMMHSTYPCAPFAGGASGGGRMRPLHCGAHTTFRWSFANSPNESKTDVRKTAAKPFVSGIVAVKPVEHIWERMRGLDVFPREWDALHERAGFRCPYTRARHAAAMIQKFVSPPEPSQRKRHVESSASDARRKDE